jgi:hypothetical protein
VGIDPCCSELAGAAEDVLLKKEHDKGGPDHMAAGLSAAAATCPSFMTRSLFNRLYGIFRRLNARGRYDFLHAVVRRYLLTYLIPYLI